MYDAFLQRLERIRAMKSQGVPLRAPLEASVVERFESEFRIVLPESYRQFLLQVGDGIAPPHPRAMNSLRQAALDAVGDRLNPAAPFALTTWWNWREEQFDDDIEERLDAVHRHGLLYLGNDHDCYWYLIIRGSRRGEVWASLDTCFQPCAPNVDFLGWFEYRLEGTHDWWRDFDYSPTPE